VINVINPLTHWHWSILWFQQARSTSRALKDNGKRLKLKLLQIPWPALVIALVIAGSDKWATIYRTYDISEQSKSGFLLVNCLRTSPSLNKARAVPRTESLERPLVLASAGGCIYNFTSSSYQNAGRGESADGQRLFTHDWACLRSASNPPHIAVYDGRSRIKHAQVFKFSYSETHISTLISSSLNHVLQPPGASRWRRKTMELGAPNHLVSSLAIFLSHIMRLLLLPLNNYRTLSNRRSLFPSKPMSLKSSPLNWAWTSYLSQLRQ
jgi:hypothetical protein